LSRIAAIHVGKHLITKLENTSLNKRHGSQQFIDAPRKHESERVCTDTQCSPLKPKNFVIGRASWMENNNDRSRWAAVDDNGH
jgi:hypothetical protein